MNWKNKSLRIAVRPARMLLPFLLLAAGCWIARQPKSLLFGADRPAARTQEEKRKTPGAYTLLMTITGGKGDVRIVEFSGAGEMNVLWKRENLSWPHSAAKLKSGDIAISEYAKNRVLIVDSKGRTKKKIDVKQPSGIGQLENGNLLVVSYEPWEAQEMDLDGKIVRRIRRRQPVDLAILPDNSIVLGCTSHGRSVFRLDSEGKTIWQFKEGVTRLQRVSYSPKEKAVYVTDYSPISKSWDDCPPPGKVFKLSEKDGSLIWKMMITFVQKVIRLKNGNFLIATHSSFGKIGEYEDDNGKPGKAVWEKKLALIADVEVLEE